MAKEGRICASSLHNYCPCSHVQLSQTTLYLFCWQKIGSLPGSQQKKNKGSLNVRGSCKVLINAKTFSIVVSLFMSDFIDCALFMLRLDGIKMQVSINALI